MGPDRSNHADGDACSCRLAPAPAQEPVADADIRTDSQSQDEEEIRMWKRKTASLYFYRQHYLSMIQEEEEPASPSKTNSIYESISIDGQTDSSFGSLAFRERPSSWASGRSLDSLTSVNSVLSNDLSSQTCYSSRSKVSGSGGEVTEASASLSLILGQVPPPPTPPPASTGTGPSCSWSLAPATGNTGPVKRSRLKTWKALMLLLIRPRKCPSRSAGNALIPYLRRGASGRKSCDQAEACNAVGPSGLDPRSPVVTEAPVCSNSTNPLKSAHVANQCAQNAASKASLQQGDLEGRPAEEGREAASSPLALRHHQEGVLDLPETTLYPANRNVAVLIAECEEYVNTELFNKEWGTKSASMLPPHNPATDADPPFRHPGARSSVYENSRLDQDVKPDAGIGQWPYRDEQQPWLGHESLSSSSDLSRLKQESPVISEYDRVWSDIEETISLWSRRSRSTTPTKDDGLAPSWYQIGSSSTLPVQGSGSRQPDDKSYRSLDRLEIAANAHHSDQVTFIEAVVDDLKDYLSESDLSPHYRIALHRRKFPRGGSLDRSSNSNEGRLHSKVELDHRRDTHVSALFTDARGPAPVTSKRSDSGQMVKKLSDAFFAGSRTSFSAPNTPLCSRRSHDPSRSVAADKPAVGLEPIPEEELGSVMQLYANQLRTSKAQARQRFFRDLQPEDDESPDMQTAVLRVAGRTYSTPALPTSESAFEVDDWRRGQVAAAVPGARYKSTLTLPDLTAVDLNDRLLSKCCTSPAASTSGDTCRGDAGAGHKLLVKRCSCGQEVTFDLGRDLHPFSAGLKLDGFEEPGSGAVAPPRPPPPVRSGCSSGVKPEPWAESSPSWPDVASLYKSTATLAPTPLYQFMSERPAGSYDLQKLAG